MPRPTAYPLNVRRPCVALAVVGLAGTFAACTFHDERVGAFVIRRQTAAFAAHSATRVSLWYGFRRITASLSDASVDPRVPERVLFASRSPGDCGTFLFDGRTGRRRQVSTRVMSVHALGQSSPLDFAGVDPWSPDGHYAYAGNDTDTPLVIDLETFRVIELSDAVTIAGRRLGMRPLTWAPDGRRLAVELAPHGFNGRRDLIAVTIETLDVRYVGSMDRAAPVWTARDFRWKGDTLAIAGDGHYAHVFRIPEADLEWRTGLPLPTFSPSVPECR